VLLISALILVGCGDSIESVEPPKLEPPPSGLTESCSRPTLIPERNLSKGEVTSYWAEDRGRHVTCVDRHEALVNYYRDRDSKIMGE
jgi:hypothetical protein